jgi:hypothetical protein
MLLMRRETSRSLSSTIGSGFSSTLLSLGDRPTVAPPLDVIGALRGGVVDWTVPPDGTWFGLADGGGGPWGGGTFVFPGFVEPGAVPGCIGTPPPTLLLAAPAFAPPAVPVPPAPD